MKRDNKVRNDIFGTNMAIISVNNDKNRNSVIRIDCSDLENIWFDIKCVNVCLKIEP